MCTCAHWCVSARVSVISVLECVWLWHAWVSNAVAVLIYFYCNKSTNIKLRLKLLKTSMKEKISGIPHFQTNQDLTLFLHYHPIISWCLRPWVAKWRSKQRSYEVQVSAFLPQSHDNDRLTPSTQCLLDTRGKAMFFFFFQRICVRGLGNIRIQEEIIKSQ